MIDHELREYYKNEFFEWLDEPPKPDEKVILAVANIYQSELGHFFEDEAGTDFYDEIGRLYEKHRNTVKDESALIDRILEDLPPIPEGSDA